MTALKIEQAFDNFIKATGETKRGNAWEMDGVFYDLGVGGYMLRKTVNGINQPFLMDSRIGGKAFFELLTFGAKVAQMRNLLPVQAITEDDLNIVATKQKAYTNIPQLADTVFYVQAEHVHAQIYGGAWLIQEGKLMFLAKGATEPKPSSLTLEAIKKKRLVKFVYTLI